MSAAKWILSGILACSMASLASEGDLLIDVGPAAVGRTYSGFEVPMLGAQFSVLKGFNDQTDIGLAASFDYGKGKYDGPSVTWTTVGIQSWFTGFNGDIRPQIGGTMGITMDSEGNAMLHLAARMRGLMELSTGFRLFAGAAAGGDIGDAGCMFAKGEFGAEFLIP